MATRIAFIDDDEKFEIPLFRETFGGDFDVLAASDFEKLRKEISNRQNWAPELFVLDLYFPDGAPDEDAIEKLKRSPLHLPNDNAEIRQAYQNYREANIRFHAVLNAWKQGPDGGLKLAKVVREKYPGVPVVFYSRKATAEDVLRCMKVDGVLDVISKPTGASDDETKQLTYKLKQTIGARFEEVIQTSRSESWAKVKEAAEVVCRGIRFFADLN